MPLPTFLIIGAGRSGTTSLYEYLRRHPQVFMSPVKETNFFALQGEEPSFRGPMADWLRATSVSRLADYRCLFEGAEAEAIGEASSGYLSCPQAAQRIHALLPGAKLVAILRNPVERTYASYLGLRNEGVESAPSFEAALRVADHQRAGRTMDALIEPGFYHRHLSRYFELFPRDSIRVYLFEDLRDHPSQLLRDLCRHIDVDPDCATARAGRHAPTGVIRNRAKRLVWRAVAPRRQWLRPLLPRFLNQAVHAWITGDLVKPPMKIETHIALQDLFRADLVALQELIQRDLSPWLAKPPAAASAPSRDSGEVIGQEKRHD